MNRFLKKALASTDVPLIIAHEARNITDVHLRRYRDEKAGTSLLTNATRQPFSPITGNPLVAERKSTMVISAADIRDLVPFAKNKDGGYVFRTTPEIAKQLSEKAKGTNVFCAVTASEIPVKINQQVLAAALDAMDDEGDDDDIGMDDSTDPDFDDTGADDSEGMSAPDDFATGETGDMDSTGGDDPGAGIGEEDAAPHAEPDGDEGGGLPPDGDADDAALNGVSDADFNLGDDSAPGGDDAVPPMTDDASSLDTDTQDATATTQMDGGMESVNNMKTNDTSLASYRVNLMEETASEKEQSFHLVLAGDEGHEVYYVMANHFPVAVAKRDAATEGVKKIFLNTAKVNTAFQNAVTAAGLTNEVMADFGIEPISIEVTASAVMEKQVEATREEERTKFEAKANELRDVMSQSLSIAAMAINKGFYKDTPNPLRVALCEVLAANNVRNPEGLVDGVFEKHGEDYLRNMLERASKLSNDSDETRNSVAKLVEEASYQPVTRAATSERVIDRVSNGNVAKTAVTASVVEETAHVTVASDGVTELRKRLGLSGGRRRLI